MQLELGVLSRAASNGAEFLQSSGLSAVYCRAALSTLKDLESGQLAQHKHLGSRGVDVSLKVLYACMLHNLRILAALRIGLKRDGSTSWPNDLHGECG